MDFHGFPSDFRTSKRAMVPVTRMGASGMPVMAVPIEEQGR